MESILENWILEISIHTPAKGVTSSKHEDAAYIVISIHTPAKGVTRITGEGIPGEPDFNPHSREGSDTKQHYKPKARKYFNPHSREGSDLSILTTSKQLEHFNPHSREGSDKPILLTVSMSLYFNPHSREGSDGIHRGTAFKS